MKLIILSDLHLGINTDSNIDELGVSTKTKEIVNNLRMVAKAFNRHECSAIVICGDIFHNNNPKPNIESLFINWLNFLEKNEIPTYIIPGNHDVTSKQNCSLNPIKEIQYKYVEVFLDVEPRTIGELNVIFAPYMPKHLAEDIDEYTKSKVSSFLRNDRTNIIVCHHQIDGAVVGSEQHMLSGGTQFLSELPKVKLVIAGHIHKRQQFKKGEMEVHYPGSMIPLDISERDEQKGFSVLDMDSLDLSLVESKYTPYYFLKIDDPLVYYERLVDQTIPNEAIVHLEINIKQKQYNSLILKKIQDYVQEKCVRLAKVIINTIPENIEIDGAQENPSIKEMIGQAIAGSSFKEKTKKQLTEINEELYTICAQKYSETWSVYE